MLRVIIMRKIKLKGEGKGKQEEHTRDLRRTPGNKVKKKKKRRRKCRYVKDVDKTKKEEETA